MIVKAQGILHNNSDFWLLLKNHSGNSEPGFPRGSSAEAEEQQAAASLKGSPAPYSCHLLSSLPHTCPISVFLRPGWHLALRPLSWAHARSGITFYLLVAMALTSMGPSPPFSTPFSIPLHLTEPAAPLDPAGISGCLRLRHSLSPYSILDPAGIFSWQHPQTLFSAQTIRAFYLQWQVPALCLQVTSLGLASLSPLAKDSLPAILPHSPYLPPLTLC